VVAFVVAAATSEAGRFYLLVLLLMQATIPVWGVLLPHAPPPLLEHLARPLAHADLTLAVLLLTHEQHPRHPRVATFDLYPLMEKKGAGPRTRPASQSLSTWRAQALRSYERWTPEDPWGPW
jgi:hypothetical protein